MTQDGASTGEPAAFAVLGVDHVHAFLLAEQLVAAGGRFVGWWSEESPLTREFAKRFPTAPRRSSPDELLADERVALVAIAAIPDRRSELACAAMRADKDVLCDKPGAVTDRQLDALRRTVAETQRRFWVFFSERFASAGTVKAESLVRAGAIGEPLHMIGMGPHLLGLTPRAPWFYERTRAGGILTDLASHQIDQFLCFFSLETAEVQSAQSTNRAHPELAAFDDFGEILLRAPAGEGPGSCYARVDWLTPAGLGTWGDVRLFLLGAEGTIEVRKNCDIEGHAGAEHVFLVDGRGTHHFACAGDSLPFAPRLLADLREGTETATSTRHCLVVSELALRSQALADATN